MRLLNPRLDTLFLRVYLGVAAAIVLLVFLSLASISLFNKVRLEVYQEELLTDFFSALSFYADANKAPLAAQLEGLNTALGIRLEVIDSRSANLNRRQQARLAENRPLVMQTAPDLLAYQAFGQENQLLKLRLQRPHEQQLRASGYLLASILQPLQPAARQAQLEQLAKGLTFPVTLLTSAQVQKLLPDRLPDKLSTQLLYQDDPHSLSVLLPLDSSSWLRLGPQRIFDPYLPSLLISVLLVDLLFLAVGIWWFLQGLDHRLRSLERASSQLAAGNLKARVSEQEKDFIGKLASTFNHMAEQIQRLLRTQQEMIHAVSHELRTPVARIRFGLQMIEDLSEDQRPHAELVRQVQGIDKDIDELDTLIDEILTYARLGQEKLQLQFVEQDVIGLIEDVVSGFQRVTPDLTLELRVDNPQGFTSEADLEGRYFQRALQNLVGNAVRYAQSRICITCYLEADNLRVDVEDDGPGIPKEDWPRVFMPFSRLDDSRTRSSGGYGLGLSIVQRIIYWHRGSALVEKSTQLGGACFSLIFPKNQSQDLPPLDLPPQ